MEQDYDNPGTSMLRLQEQPWYMGKVTRVYSESILEEDGEFLVRDAISNPGEYVLTVKWKRKALSFQINSVMEKGRKMYHFEEEQFGSVVGLIEFYKSHRRPITLTSGALIMKPAEKKNPEPANVNSKELEASYMHIFKPGQQTTQRSLSQQVLVNQATMRQTRPLRPMSTIEQERIPAVPLVLANRPLPLPVRSPRNSDEDGNDYCEMDYDSMDHILDASSLSTKHRSGSMQSLPATSLSRQFQSCMNLRSASPSPSIHSIAKPTTYSTARPPLPPRPPNLSEKSYSVPVTKPLRTPEEEARDSAFVDYDDLKPKTKFEDDYDRLSAEVELEKRLSDGSNTSDYDHLNTPQKRQRDSGIYSSPSPPNETVNFSHCQLSQMKLFLLNKKPSDIAQSITYEDVKFLRFLGLSEKAGQGADNGLRMILLPHGNQLRKDLIARSKLLQLAVLLSLASNSKNEAPRIARQWILTASSLLNKEGNIYGFVNIFTALENPILNSLNIFNALDLQAKSEYDLMKQDFNDMKSHKFLRSAGVVIPFIQPVLEIFGQEKCQYLDESGYGLEIDSFWRWLDEARVWTRDADGMRDAARGRFIRSRAATENPMAGYNLERLLAGPGSTTVDRFSLVLNNIQKLIDDTA